MIQLRKLISFIIMVVLLVPLLPCGGSDTVAARMADVEKAKATSEVDSCEGNGLRQASFFLDGVPLNLCTSFLPGGEFIVSEPSYPVQIASAVDWGNSADELSIKAIPFGTRPSTEGLPVAQAGGAEVYRNALADYRKLQGGHSQIGPTADLFGQQVTGMISIVNLYIDVHATRPVVIVEWVVEAGNRLWIVRAGQEIEIVGSRSLQSQVELQVNQLDHIHMGSSNLSVPSTSVAAQKSLEPLSDPSVPLETNDDLPFPSWWDGDCDKNYYHSQTGIWAYPLGGSYRGVKACGPRPYYDNAPDVLVHFFPGAWGEYEWECVELSMRYLYLAYGIDPYQANGKDVVPNYNGSRLEKINNGTQGKAPQAGDVLSYSAYEPWGHTTIVQGSNVNDQGNGTITILEQNGASSGVRSHTVSNWYVQDSQNVIGWLHDNTGTCVDESPPNGDYYDGNPQAGGWYNSSAYLKAWGQDHGCDPPSGVDQVLFRAYYSGGWHTVRDDGSDCSGGSRCDYDYTWNLSGVPDGQITMGFDLKDKNGNWAYTPQGTFPIYKYSDDPPHIFFNYANGNLVNHNGQDFKRNNPNWSFSGTAIDDQGVDHVDYHSQGSNGTLTYRANGATNWDYSRNGLYGHNRVYFFAYDTRGQRNPDGDKHYIDLYVDTSAPTTGHNLAGTLGQNGWYVSPVQVSLVAHDNGSGNGSDHWAAGVQALYYQIDSGSWQQHSGSSKTITVSGDGTHTVRYYARDKVGNQEGQHEVSFKIDATPPTAPGTATEAHGVVSGQWQKDFNDPAFTWPPANDTLSGLWYYRVTWNDTLQVTTDPAYDPPAVGTGSYQLGVQAVDRAGNVGSAGAAFTFRYDGTPPHAPDIQNNDDVPSGVWQNQVRTADFSWSTPHDDGSGIAGYNVYWGPDPEGTSDALTPDNTFMDSTPICAADEAAIYYLRARSRDNVDWPSEWVAYALAYDGAPPTATLVANYGQPVVHQTTVHLDVLGDDEGSGVAGMRLTNDPRNWPDEWSDYAEETYWEIPALGRNSHPIYLQLVDGAGNVSAVVSDTVYLDVNAPAPKSENFWLWDDATPAGAAEANSASYNLRSSVGQSLDSPVLTSLDYTLVGGYQAGALAEPTLTPTYTVYLQLGQVIASGGTGATTLQSPDFQMYGTLGQPAVVVSITSESYVLLTGFWGGAGTDPQPPGPPPPPPPPPPPECEFYSLSINDGALVTNSPQVTLTLCGPDAEDVMLSNDGGFGGATWQVYTTTLPWTLEVYGQYVQPRFVYSRFRDGVGAIYGTFFDDILYDPNAPDGEAVFDLASLLPPTGTQTLDAQPLRVVNEDSVDLFVSATDDSSGLAEMQVSLEPDFPGAEWQPFSAIVPVTFTTEGTNTIYVRFRDRAGNVSDETSDSLVVDTTPPIGAASVPKIVGPSAISVTVVLSATDDTTGVSDVRISARESFTDTLWQPYAPQVTVPISFTGDVRPVLHVQFRDTAGNESTVYSTTYAVDATPPIGIARVEPGTGMLRTVTFGALDYGSGVAEIHLSPDYFFVENVTTIPYTTSISWDFDQSPVVYVKFEDGVGNLSSRVSAVLREDQEQKHHVYVPLVIKNQ